MGAIWSSTPVESKEPTKSDKSPTKSNDSPNKLTITLKKKPLKIQKPFKIQTQWIKTHARKKSPVGEVRYVSLPEPTVTLLFKHKGHYYDTTGKDVTTTLPQEWQKAHPAWNMPDEMLSADVDATDWVGVFLQPVLTTRNQKTKRKRKKKVILPPLQLIDFIFSQEFMEEWDGDGQYPPGVFRSFMVQENVPPEDQKEYELYESLEELTSALDAQETDILVMESDSYDYFHFSCQHKKD
jgi:hypothetical protein